MKNQAIIPVLPHGGDNVAVFEEYVKNKISNFLGAWYSSSSDAGFFAVLPNKEFLLKRGRDLIKGLKENLVATGHEIQKSRKFQNKKN